MLGLLFWIFVLVLPLVAWLVWALARPWIFARKVRRAARQFERNRSTLETAFFQAASASGKPRGLSWKECGFQPGVLIARDRSNGDLVGLVAATISFEAVPGGGMEDVEAVGNLRRHGRIQLERRPMGNARPRGVQFGTARGFTALRR